MSDIQSELTLTLRSPSGLLMLVSVEEERVERLLRTACKGVGKPLLAWSLVAGFGKGEHTDPISALEAVAATQRPAVFLLKDLYRFLDQPAVVRRLRDMTTLAAKHDHTIILLSPQADLPPELEAVAEVMTVPLPGYRDMVRILEALLELHSLTLDHLITEELARAALGLTELQARRALQRSIVRSGGLTRDDIPHLLREKARLLRSCEAIEFCDRSLTMDQVGGLEELKGWVAERAEAFSERARTFGLPQPRGLLLLGVQGCGKSLTAKAVAGLWRLPLLRLDLAAAFSSPRGPEANIRQAEMVAEALSPSVLWIDEIDKAFGGAAQEGGASSRVLGSFVTWLQEKTNPVFVIATANSIEALPPELLRKGRFDEIFFVDLPDGHEREKILRIHVQTRGRDPQNYDLQALSALTEHFAGSELEQVVVAGLYTAFAEGRDLLQADLERAAKETVPLYETYEDQIKALREWARRRTRRATTDASLLDLFEKG